LPNRRLLNDRLRQTIAICKRNRQVAGLLFIDLDSFKPLNDQYGHDLGDLLLVEVARRISNCVREADTVSRFGGDEFVVILNDVALEMPTSIEQIKTVAEKIRSVIAMPYRLHVHRDSDDSSEIDYLCTSSIGVALLTHTSTTTMDEILRNADRAMYIAKSGGGNMVQFADTL
jgi:diguanylate cyclase (GGDEF)-like protein